MLRARQINLMDEERSPDVARKPKRAKTASPKSIEKPHFHSKFGAPLTPEAAVGWNIKVWWPKMKKWYAAMVLSFDKKSQKHVVRYKSDRVEQKLRLTAGPDAETLKWIAGDGTEHLSVRGHHLNAVKSSRQRVKAPRVLPVVNEDDDSESGGGSESESEEETLYECERDCGFEHADRSIVEKHEAACQMQPKKRFKKPKPAPKACPTESRSLSS